MKDFLQKTIGFIYESGTMLSRPGIYGLSKDELTIALEEYLRSGENKLEELDKIVYMRWYLDSYDRNCKQRTRNDYTWSGYIDRDDRAFWCTVLNRKNFWNIDAYWSEEEKDLLSKLILFSEQEDERKSEYSYKRKEGFTEELKKAAKQRDGYRCVKCRSVELLEVDHILCLIKGGENNLENLQTLCKPCHRKKTKKDLRRSLLKGDSKAREQLTPHVGR